MLKINRRTIFYYNNVYVLLDKPQLRYKNERLESITRNKRSDKSVEEDKDAVEEKNDGTNMLIAQNA